MATDVLHDETEQLASAAYLESQREDTSLSDTLEQPPSYISRGLLYLFLVFMLVGLIYCAVSHVDITRTSQATIIPEGRINALQPPCDGNLVEMLVREGDRVKKGQVLAVVESPQVATNLATLNSAEHELSDSQRDLNQIIPLREEQSRTQSDILEAKIASLEQSALLLAEREVKEEESLRLAKEMSELELAKQDETVGRLKVELKNAIANQVLWAKERDAVQALLAKKAATQLQFLSLQRSHDESAGEVEKLESLARESQQERQIVERQFNANRNKHESELINLRELLARNNVDMQSARLEIVQLKSQLQVLKLEALAKHQLATFHHKQALAQAVMNLRGVSEETLDAIAKGTGTLTNRTVVKAPANGRIGQVFARHAGDAVDRAKPLLTLVPSGMVLVTELKISNNDIGLMKPGLPVRLKFDAFPFGEYGAIAGKLVKIAPDAETDASKPSYYRAYSSLDQDYFRVDQKKVRLLPGMTATAEITTERKTILALLLKPFLEFGKSRPAKK